MAQKLEFSEGCLGYAGASGKLHVGVPHQELTGKKLITLGVRRDGEPC